MNKIFSSVKKLLWPVVAFFTLCLSAISLKAQSSSSPKEGHLGAPILEWSEITKASEYQIEIAKDKNFKTVLVKESSTSTSYEWQGYLVGTFYWRVAGIDGAGTVGQFSTPSLLRIKLTPPRPLTSPIVYDFVDREEDMGLPARPIPLSWQAQRFAEKFRVEVSKDSSFSKAKSVETTSNQVEVPIESHGTYFWRITALAEDGSHIGKSSSAIKTQYVRSLKIPAPEPLRPMSGPVKLYNKNLLTLQWETVPVADRYEIEFSQDKSFSTSIQKVETKNPYFTLPKQPTPGQYYARVRARKMEHVSLWVTADYQIERENLVIPPPQEVGPDRTFYLTGIEPALIPVDWTKAAKAQSYGIEVSLTPNFSKIVEMHFSKDTSANIALAPGNDYFFRITSLDRHPTEFTPINSNSLTASEPSKASKVRVQSGENWQVKLGYGTLTENFDQSGVPIASTLAKGEGSTTDAKSILVKGQWFHKTDDWGLEATVRADQATLAFKSSTGVTQSTDFNPLNYDVFLMKRRALSYPWSVEGGPGLVNNPYPVFTQNGSVVGVRSVDFYMFSQKIGLHYSPLMGRWTIAAIGQLGLGLQPLFRGFLLKPVLEMKYRFSSFSASLEYSYTMWNRPLANSEYVAGNSGESTLSSVQNALMLSIGIWD